MRRKAGRREEQILDLVASIYDASFDREHWTAFFERCADAIGAHAFGLSFVAFDFWADRPPLSLGIDPDFLPRYPRYHERDVRWSRALRSQPVGRVCDVLPWATLERTTIYEEWLQPQRFRHLLHVLLWRDPPRRAGLLVARRSDSRPFSERQRTLVARLVPHMRRSIDIQRRIGMSDGALAGGLDVLDRLAIGILLVNAEGRVVFANRAADDLLCTTKMLGARSGVLHAADAATTATLRALIANAAGTTAEHNLATGGALVLPGPGDTSLHVLVTPLGSRTRSAWSAEGMAAVLVSDASRGAPVSRDAVLALYGLTKAQAELAARLAEGFSLEEIADDLGRTISTVRDRVKQVYARTGTRRQSDLVRLLLRGPAAFRLPVN